MQVSSSKLTSRKKQKTNDLDDAVIPHLSASKDKEIIHKLFSYPAKFQANLPQSIISKFTKPGDLILDPFSGGGTTSAEAMRQGRNSYAMDLNPISVLASKAKTTKLSQKDFTELFSLLNSLIKPRTHRFINEEESLLLGKELADFTEAIAKAVQEYKTKKFIPLLATLAIKRIKLATRRDKEHLRKTSFAGHINYVCDEVEKIATFFASEQMTSLKSTNEVEYGSNHDIPLKANAAKLIITSPPYPGVDIEYNLIQLQRRDLSRCYRSDLAQRMSELVISCPYSPSKKELCNGGVGTSDYWFNAKKSLLEMNRVLQKGGMCFLYIGFKEVEQRKLYEKIAEQAGFTVEESYVVELGHERVASSRGTFHGRETKMMKTDILYVLRK